VLPYPLWHANGLPSRKLFAKIIYAFLLSHISAPHCSENVRQTSGNEETYNISCGCLNVLPKLHYFVCDLPMFSICRSCVWILSWTSSSDNRAVAINSNCGPLWSKEKQTQCVYQTPTCKQNVYQISKSVNATHYVVMLCKKWNSEHFINYL
jgi:hypothetical protein